MHIFAGVGFGLVMPAMYTMFNHYFVKRRVTMIGIIATLCGFVSIGMPTSIEMLMQEYGFRGCMAILAALNLHVLLGMIVLYPVERYQKNVACEIESSEDDTDESVEILEFPEYITVETSYWYEIKNNLNGKANMCKTI